MVITMETEMVITMEMVIAMETEKAIGKVMDRVMRRRKTMEIEEGILTAEFNEMEVKFVVYAI